MIRILRAWLIRFVNLFRKTRRERELAEEIESNLQLHIDENIRSGIEPDTPNRGLAPGTSSVLLKI